MNRDMILAGIVNNLVGTTFTVLLIVFVFLGRRLWLKYGPKSKSVSKAVRVKYTCPHCKETFMISPVYEKST